MIERRKQSSRSQLSKYCLGLLFALSAYFAYGKEDSVTKSVEYRSAVKFNIPNHWVVEDEPGIQGLFYDDQFPDSGTLRLSVFEWPSETERERNEKIRRALLPGTIETLTKGVYLRKERFEGLETSEVLHLHQWLVALALPNNLFRSIIFTYTIVAGQENDPAIAAEMATIEHAVRNAEYSYRTDLEFVDQP